MLITNPVRLKRVINQEVGQAGQTEWDRIPSTSKGHKQVTGIKANLGSYPGQVQTLLWLVTPAEQSSHSDGVMGVCVWIEVI